MSRPVAVTASGVVAIVGSLCALGFGVLALGSLFITPPAAGPSNSVGAVLSGVALFLVLGGMGIWTSIGLFRLRPWARTSILIFAGLLAATSLFALAITMLAPLPPTVSSGEREAFRLFMGVVFGVLLLIGIWWLVQFNSPSTAAAFSRPTTGVATQRPMTATVVAVLMILGAVAFLFPLFGRAPIFLLGQLVTGWAATTIYILLIAVSLYIAKGLLDLRERARLLGIAWFALWFLHAFLITLVPTLRQRLMARMTLPPAEAPIPFAPALLMDASLVAVTIMAAAVIFFLLRDRTAFLRAENARDWPGLHA
jgi:hypothetical protein